MNRKQIEAQVYGPTYRKIASHRELIEKTMTECDHYICTWEAWHPVSMPDEATYMRALLERDGAKDRIKVAERHLAQGNPILAEGEMGRAENEMIHAWGTMRSLFRTHMPISVQLAESL